MQEVRSKQGHTNNKAKQHNTPKAVTFPKKNELPQVGHVLHPSQTCQPSMVMYCEHCKRRGEGRGGEGRGGEGRGGEGRGGEGRGGEGHCKRPVVAMVRWRWQVWDVCEGQGGREGWDVCEGQRGREGWGRGTLSVL